MGGFFGGKTQTSAPAQAQAPQIPDYLKPYMEPAAASARGLYQSGQLATPYFPGNTVAPLSSQTQGGINMITQRAQQGNPLLPAAQNQMMNTINGNYLYADNNPYLQNAMTAANRGTMQQFGESVLPSLQANFSKAGRSSSDAMGNTIGRTAEGFARTLQDSNAMMAANNLQNERTNQMAASSQAPDLAMADYNDANQLLQAGALQDEQNQNELQGQIDRYNYNNSLPEASLQKYIQLLNGTAGTAGGFSTAGATYSPMTKTQSTMYSILGLLGAKK